MRLLQGITHLLKSKSTMLDSNMHLLVSKSQVLEGNMHLLTWAKACEALPCLAT